MNITRIFGQIKSLLYLGTDPVGPANPVPTTVSGVATENKQDDIIVELQGIAGNQLPDNHQVSLSNQIVQPTTPSDIQPSEIIPVLRQILMAIANPSYVDKSVNAIRNQVQSGTITTVTTVTTVTGLTNIDSYQGKLLIINQNINAWANCVRANIT